MKMKCDALLDSPFRKSPPPEPVKQKIVKPKQPKKWVFPPKFPMLSSRFYFAWCNHWKILQYPNSRVDSKPPALFPDIYLKPRRLNQYAQKFNEVININKELVKKINFIQRSGGLVDCHRTHDNQLVNKLCKRKRKYRQAELKDLRKKNLILYNRLTVARSSQQTTKELNEYWMETKEKLILGSQLPFILFKTDVTIDKNMKDPSFDRPFDIVRPKVWMDFRVLNGAKLGRVTIELFTDVVPQTCKLFLMLLKGDDKGHSYCGTKIFRIVPNLCCRGGDVIKDNGYGGFHLDPHFVSGMEPENFTLKHTVPGVMSMAVNQFHEITGQFNIMFKPLSQFDGAHVVFGRIVSGPPLTLERISALGLPLGTPTATVVVHQCGWFVKRRRFYGYKTRKLLNTTKVGGSPYSCHHDVQNCCCKELVCQAIPRLYHGS